MSDPSLPHVRTERPPLLRGGRSVHVSAAGTGDAGVGTGSAVVRRRRTPASVGAVSGRYGLSRLGALVRGGPDGPPGGLGGLLLRLLLAAAGAGAVRDASDAGGSSEGLLVVGTGLGDQVLGHAEALGRGELLETGLPVQAGAEVGGLLDQRVEQPVHQFGGRVEALVEIDRADHRFQGVGEDGRLVPAARALFAPAEPDEGAQVEAAADLRQRTRVDHRGPQLGQLAFGQVGVGAVQRVRDHQAEHGVPEELQPLVGGQTAVLVRVGTVGQRTHQKGGLELVPEPPFQKRVGRGRVVRRFRRRSASALGVRHGASHPPLRPRGPGACCRCRKTGTRCAAASARGSARTPPGWGPQPSTATGGGACCCATSSASEQPRLLLLLLVDAALAAPLISSFSPSSSELGESLQCRPTDVDGVMVVVRVVREPRSALGAQARAVVLAHRLHRQCEHHRVTQHGLEVEQAVLEEEPVLVFLGVVGRFRLHAAPVVGVGVREHLLEVRFELAARAAPDTLRTPPRPVHGRCL